MNSTTNEGVIVCINYTGIWVPLRRNIARDQLETTWTYSESMQHSNCKEDVVYKVVNGRNSETLSAGCSVSRKACPPPPCSEEKLERRSIGARDLDGTDMTTPVIMVFFSVEN